MGGAAGAGSSFNVVSDWYPLDEQRLEELLQRGHEIGSHAIRHDRSLFASRASLEQQLPLLRDFAERFGAVGFRSPATHRVVDWLCDLPFSYDCTMPHSDPYEPIPRWDRDRVAVLPRRCRRAALHRAAGSHALQPSRASRQHAVAHPARSRCRCARSVPDHHPPRRGLPRAPRGRPRLLRAAGLDRRAPGHLGGAPAGCRRMVEEPSRRLHAS